MWWCWLGFFWNLMIVLKVFCWIGVLIFWLRMLVWSFMFCLVMGRSFRFLMVLLWGMWLWLLLFFLVLLVLIGLRLFNVFFLFCMVVWFCWIYVWYVSNVCVFDGCYGFLMVIGLVLCSRRLCGFFWILVGLIGMNGRCFWFVMLLRYFCVMFVLWLLVVIGNFFVIVVYDNVILWFLMVGDFDIF